MLLRKDLKRFQGSLCCCVGRQAVRAGVAAARPAGQLVGPPGQSAGAWPTVAMGEMQGSGQPGGIFGEGRRGPVDGFGMGCPPVCSLGNWDSEESALGRSFCPLLKVTQGCRWQIWGSDPGRPDSRGPVLSKAQAKMLRSEVCWSQGPLESI